MKWLSSIINTLAPDDEPAATPVPAAPPAPQYHFPVVPQPAITALGAVNATVDNGVLNQLMDEVSKDAPQKYAQFTATLEKLAKVSGSNPVTQYQSAAAVVGISKMEIGAAIDSLQKRLDQEKTEYAKSLEVAKAQKVGTLTQQLSDLRGHIEELKKQIAEKQEEISKGEMDGQKLQTDISAASANIQGAQATFETTAAHVREQLEAVRQHADQYLT